jgi:hypothetical protein
MTSSSVVATAPLTRISAAAPSMSRCRVARPFAVNLCTSVSVVARAGLTGQTIPGRTSDAAANIHGVVLSVDGGWAAT